MGELTATQRRMVATAGVIALLVFPSMALALRPAGVEEAASSVKEELLAGLEATGVRPEMSRRSFLQVGAAAATALQPALAGAGVSEEAAWTQARKIAGYLSTLEGWVQAELNGFGTGKNWHEQVKQLFSARDEVTELVKALPEDHTASRWIHLAEKQFEQELARMQGPESSDSVKSTRAQALSRGLQHPDQLDLWMTIRSTVWFMENQLEISLDSEREFSRAVENEISPDQYLELSAQRAMESPLIQATAREWKRLGIDPEEKEIARAVRVFLGFGQGLVQQGLDVNLGLWQDHGETSYPRGLFKAWEESRFKKIWPPVEKRISERIKRRFGGDGVVEIAYYPGGWDKETGRVRSLSEAMRETLSRSRAASLRHWRERLSAEAARFLRRLRRQGAEISEQAIDEEVNRFDRMPGRELARFSESRFQEEIARRYPVPEPRPLSGHLPVPLSPVERLSWRVARAAEQGRVVLWIRTHRETADLRGVWWRPQEEFASSLGRTPDHPGTYQLSREDLRELDRALGQDGSRRVNIACRIEVPAGTSAAALRSFLTNVNWWRYPAHPRRAEVHVPWPIALPAPIASLPQAGEASSGLEEQVFLHQEAGSSV